MASLNQSRRDSLYPEVLQANPEAPSLHSFSNPNPISNPPPSFSSSNLYPTIDTSDLAENLFSNYYEHTPTPNQYVPLAPPQATEHVLIKIPGAILNLIDRDYSVELASGDLSIFYILQDQNVVALLARIDDQVQWPLAKDEAAVKLDDSHYFFSLRAPNEQGSDLDVADESENVLNYGLTIASKGQEGLLSEFDRILETYSSFSVHKGEKGFVLDGFVDKEMSPGDLKSEEKKELMEGRCAAYWTTLAPNVEDYSSSAAKLIASGSGQLIRGILWCGDVTVDRLKWGNEVMKKRMSPRSNAKISPQTLKRIQRVKGVTKMTQQVAGGVLSGVIKVSGFFTSAVANSKVGKKLLGLVPGEILLASLDGFCKVCDAAEVSGKSVLSTSSTVTTDVMSHRYGEQAGQATSEGLGAAGHAIGTAWTVFKIRKALNPKSVLKPTTLAKSAAKGKADELRAKNSK